MIDIKKKEDCVGCNACVQICPKECISLTSDNQGFSYPNVELERCINCRLCEKVCPVINQEKTRQPYRTHAALNPNDKVLHNSSSGGIFYALAEKTIMYGGVVFGARFDSNWNAIHDHTDSLDEIRKFQKSKYLQSKIGKSYKEVQDYLKSGIRVLFSGTPCQIAGLRSFLRKDYEEQLILVDIVCHGVPSPLIWQQYLKGVVEQEGFSTKDIINIDFRDKRMGWETYGMSILFKNNVCEDNFFSPLGSDVYMHGFLKNLYLRPSCYKCPSKCGKAHSDITLGDFWGIRNKHSELYSHKGVSLILANTKKGEELLDTLPICLHPVSYA
ncbi:MAG: Coenzyme F420 hydrogenase/dehydrogenase, beta subunit C-terminal domain, partial [Muribaculaceae bacterium]|nr:Coenzyme F420 hydrogenase/dehydrogenase, beta subunit C-terminal domain [Muribaculaceae bacterium]